MTLGDKKQLLSLGSETEMSLDGTGNSSDNGSMIRQSDVTVDAYCPQQNTEKKV